MCTPRYGGDLHVSAWDIHQVWRLAVFILVQELILLCSQVDPRYHCGDNARVLGLCTGALAAAAVSCSQSTLDLIPLGVCAVRVAFRTGVHVTDVAQRVAPIDTSAQSWSMIVSGLESGEAAVKDFCGQTVSILDFRWLEVVSHQLTVCEILDSSPNQQALYKRVHAQWGNR